MIWIGFSTYLGGNDNTGESNSSEGGNKWAGDMGRTSFMGFHEIASLWYFLRTFPRSMFKSYYIV